MKPFKKEYPGEKDRRKKLGDRRIGIDRRELKTVQNIIPWLRTVEMLASNVYDNASEKLAKDQQFTAFLSRMSDDEAWHYHILGSAAQYLRETENIPQPAIAIDSHTKDMVQKPFLELYEAMENRNINRKDVINCIIKAEFAELNSIFVYILSTLQEISGMFQHVAATIESHIERIQKFLENLPEDVKVPEETWKLPVIWDKKILIVEDETSLRELLSNVLKGLGSIETAANGREGLDKTKKNFFNAVVSNIDLPIMNGIEFYQKTVEANPNINRQFIFFTGTITPDVSVFLQKNHLPYLEKPFSLGRLNRTVREIIDKTL